MIPLPYLLSLFLWSGVTFALVALDKIGKCKMEFVALEQLFLTLKYCFSTAKPSGYQNKLLGAFGSHCEKFIIDAL